MEDVSTLVWIGIAVVWLLVKLIRSGSQRAAKAIREKAAQQDPAVMRQELEQQPSATPIGGRTAAVDGTASARPIEPR